MLTITIHKTNIPCKKATFWTFFVIISLFSCKSSKKITPLPIPKEEVVLEEPIENETNEEELIMKDFLSEYLTLKYPDKDFSSYLYVSIKHQELFLIENHVVIKKYPISTAKEGIGSEYNSLKTPPGLHKIKRKIGDDVPLGGILESRVYNGKTAQILEEKIKANGDYVTTRVLWLEGEEVGINKGRNVDSYNRYIYIHGTPEEGLIGEPASHGCIRMKNTDVMELYELVDEGIPILILEK